MFSLLFCFFQQVPLGTLFKDEDGNLVADLKAEGDMLIGARGGAGGKGNFFFLTNENRAPMVFEHGGKGEERLLFAELRVMAHAGLVRCLSTMACYKEFI